MCQIEPYQHCVIRVGRLTRNRRYGRCRWEDVMSEKPDPKSAIRRYFSREISLKDAVAVLDAYVLTPEPAETGAAAREMRESDSSSEAAKESSEPKQ